jgi:hypothetical protein
MWTVVTQGARSFTAILCEIRVELLEFWRGSQVNEALTSGSQLLGNLVVLACRV